MPVLWAIPATWKREKWPGAGVGALRKTRDVLRENYYAGDGGWQRREAERGYSTVVRETRSEGRQKGHVRYNSRWMREREDTRGTQMQAHGTLVQWYRRG